MKKKIIYCIPGVGADKQVFKFLQFPEEYEVRHIIWQPNDHYDEPLKEYVKKLLPQFDTENEIYLCGLSFGGIVASELAKLLPVQRVIIISSIKTRYERPLKAGLLRYMQLYRYFPAKILTKINFWHTWAFGKLNADEKALVNDMISRIDIDFNEWAIHQAIIWDNVEVVPGIIHIHGDADTIFPISYIRKCHKIKGGTHFMIVNRAAEISKIIQTELLLHTPKPYTEISQERGF